MNEQDTRMICWSFWMTAQVAHCAIAWGPNDQYEFHVPWHSSQSRKDFQKHIAEQLPQMPVWVRNRLSQLPIDWNNRDDKTKFYDCTGAGAVEITDAQAMA